MLFETNLFTLFSKLLNRILNDQTIGERVNACKLPSYTKNHVLLLLA